MSIFLIDTLMYIYQQLNILEYFKIFVFSEFGVTIKTQNDKLKISQP